MDYRRMRHRGGVLWRRRGRGAGGPDTRRLTDTWVVAVVGPITSPFSLVAAPLLGAARIPQFGVGSATALADPVSPTCFEPAR